MSFEQLQNQVDNNTDRLDSLKKIPNLPLLSGNIPTGAFVPFYNTQTQQEEKINALDLLNPDLDVQTEIGNLEWRSIGDLPNVAFSETDEVQPLFDALNARPLTQIPHNSNFYFSTVNIVATSSNTATADKRFYLLRNKITNMADADGVYFGQGSGLTLSAANMKILRFEQQTISLVNGEVTNTAVNDLGVINATPIEDAINAAGPFTPVNEFVLFEANDGTSTNYYIYTGAEDQIGTGAAQVTANDIRMIDPANSDTPTTSIDKVIKVFGENGDPKFGADLLLQDSDTVTFTKDPTTGYLKANATVTVNGSVDGNATYINRGNATEDVAPTSGEIADPQEGDTAIVNLTSGKAEYWNYTTAWNKAYTIDYNGTKPVTSYASQSALLADQANHKEGYVYYDGTNEYVYNGTPTGSISDYRLRTSGGGEQNVQSDWNQTDNTQDDFIKNKPVITQEVEPFIGDVLFDQEFVLDASKRSFVNKTPIVQGGETIDTRLVNTFRIPSIAILPNGNVFVTCEARIPDSSDESEAELYYAILDNKQVTQEGFLVNKGSNNKIANPKMIVKDGILYVFYTVFDVGGIIDSNTTTCSIFYITSSDNGLTFTAPTEMLPGDQSVSSTFKYMTSPSKAIKAPTGEIIIPFWGKDFTNSTDRTDPTVYRSGIIVFATVANTIVKKVLPYEFIAEPVCYFDNVGNLIIDNRVLGTNDDIRQVYYSTDLGDTWNEHASTGRDTSPVYVDLVSYRNNVIRAEIGLGLSSGQRKNLDLLIGDTNNENYTKISNLTLREENIWGYTSLDKVDENILVLSEDKPNVNLYDFKIVDDPYDIFYTDSNPQLTVIYDLNPQGTTLDPNVAVLSDIVQIGTTQVTGAIIMTDNTTESIGSESLTTDTIFNDDLVGNSRFIYFKITKANDSFCQLLIDDGNGASGNTLSLRTSNNDNNDVRLKVVEAGTTTFDTSVSGEPFDGSFKIELSGSNVTIYKWNGTAYAQLLTSTYTEFNYFFRIIRAISSTNGETTEFNRLVVSKADWTGEIPS